MRRARLIRDFLSRGTSHRYGTHASQRADLHLPRSPGPHAVVVLIHGGSWHKRYGKIVMRALAADLTRRGWAVWNIEYRRLGEGGGWPATFEDVAAAIDHLRLVEAQLDLEDVTVIGHSAGGHLALWAAGRERLEAGAPGAGPALRPRRVVGQAAVSSLADAYRLWHGGAARSLMGGSPEEVPGRYAVGDPIELLPLTMPALLVHGSDDETVSVELARTYLRAAEASGSPAELVEIRGAAGAHRAHIDPRGQAWAAVTSWLEGSSMAALRSSTPSSGAATARGGI